MCFSVKVSHFFCGGKIPGDLSPESFGRPEALFRTYSTQENDAQFAAIEPAPAAPQKYFAMHGMPMRRKGRPHADVAEAVDPFHDRRRTQRQSPPGKNFHPEYALRQRR